MTLRLDEDLAEELDVARRVLGVPAVELLRVAIARYLEELRADAAFQDELSILLQRNAAALRRVQSGGGEAV